MHRDVHVSYERENIYKHDEFVLQVFSISFPLFSGVDAFIAFNLFLNRYLFQLISYQYTSVKMKHIAKNKHIRDQSLKRTSHQKMKGGEGEIQYKLTHLFSHIKWDVFVLDHV